MYTILGIDAAWTVGQPSGVALVCGSPVDGWRCLCAAPSYQSFIASCHGVSVPWKTRKHTGGNPDIALLLAAASKRADGASVNIAALDMPISKGPILGRREADNAVNRAFSRVGCGTHSPTPERPGRLGANITCAFAQEGYPVIACDKTAGTVPGILEVYPHPAVMQLLGENYRVRYKQSKSRKYWPDLNRKERISMLLVNYRRILSALSSVIDGIDVPLPDAHDCDTFSSLKKFEDTIDALVCAWIGCRYIAGKAKAYGDSQAAVWIPD